MIPMGGTTGRHSKGLGVVVRRRRVGVGRHSQSDFSFSHCESLFVLRQNRFPRRVGCGGVRVRSDGVGGTPSRHRTLPDSPSVRCLVLVSRPLHVCTESTDLPSSGSEAGVETVVVRYTVGLPGGIRPGVKGVTHYSG